MSTSQGPYGRIEQMLYVIRDTYEICRAGEGGVRTGIGRRWFKQCFMFVQRPISNYCLSTCGTVANTFYRQSAIKVLLGL